MPAKLAARALDLDTLKSPIVGGSFDVIVENFPQARVGDAVGPICGGLIVGGSPTVFVNGSPAARILDPTSCSHVITSVTSVKTLIGEGPAAAPFKVCLAKAAKMGMSTIAKG